MWIKCNPNPRGKEVPDCVVRAIAIATDQSWLDVYDAICAEGRMEFNMPSVNAVWGKYLYSLGFEPFIHELKALVGNHGIGRKVYALMHIAAFCAPLFGNSPVRHLVYLTVCNESENTEDQESEYGCAQNYELFLIKAHKFHGIILLNSRSVLPARRPR